MTPQRLHARQGREAWKIQSELHGDMQRPAEMTGPAAPKLDAVSNNN